MHKLTAYVDDVILYFAKEFRDPQYNILHWVNTIIIYTQYLATMDQHDLVFAIFEHFFLIVLLFSRPELCVDGKS